MQRTFDFCAKCLLVPPSLVACLSASEHDMSNRARSYTPELWSASYATDSVCATAYGFRQVAQTEGTENLVELRSTQLVRPCCTVQQCTQMAERIRQVTGKLCFTIGSNLALAVTAEILLMFSATLPSISFKLTQKSPALAARETLLYRTTVHTHGRTH